MPTPRYNWDDDKIGCAASGSSDNADGGDGGDDADADGLGYDLDLGHCAVPDDRELPPLHAYPQGRDSRTSRNPPTSGRSPTPS